MLTGTGIGIGIVKLRLELHPPLPSPALKTRKRRRRRFLGTRLDHPVVVIVVVKRSPHPLRKMLTREERLRRRVIRSLDSGPRRN
jgi:hypothetical protein